MIVGIVGIIALVLVGWYVMFVHFGRGPVFPFLPTLELEAKEAEPMQLADNPLMATVATEEEAKEIADLYEITFVSFEYGVAVYQTEEDPMKVIARGQENDFPQLSLNMKRELQGGNTEMETEINLETNPEMPLIEQKINNKWMEEK
ncbi:MAG: hypothetical protein K2O59_16455 [Lachnospiraceae bacterium]|nr:hypothetical protein [Lachnospiraceae bacterium]